MKFQTTRLLPIHEKVVISVHTIEKNGIYYDFEYFLIKSIDLSHYRISGNKFIYKVVFDETVEKVQINNFIRLVKNGKDVEV